MESRTKFTNANPSLSSLPSLTTTPSSLHPGQTPSPNSTTPSPTTNPTTSLSTSSPSEASTREREARLLRLYGQNLTTPPRRFASHLKSERKYFDSGDYACSKAGKGDGVDLGAVGTEHPEVGRIPHPFRNSIGGGNGRGSGGNGKGEGEGGEVGERRRSSLAV